MTSLDRCPSRGCAPEGSGEALANERKRSTSTATLARSRVVDFDTMRALEASAARRVSPGEVPTPAARAALASFTPDELRGPRSPRPRLASPGSAPPELGGGGPTLAGGPERVHDDGGQGGGVEDGSRVGRAQEGTWGEFALGEGAAVRISGYIAGVRASGPESVNCRLHGAANNDLHVELVPLPGDPPERGMVVEMIPQGRPAAWSAHTLAALARARAQVLVVGVLFYDSRHRVNVAPPWLRGEPRRFTLWEVHPVTELYRCAAPPCSPFRADGWVAVGEPEHSP